MWPLPVGRPLGLALSAWWSARRVRGAARQRARAGLPADRGVAGTAAQELSGFAPKLPASGPRGRPDVGHGALLPQALRFRVTGVRSTAPSHRVLAQHVGDLVVSARSYRLFAAERGRGNGQWHGSRHVLNVLAHLAWDNPGVSPLRGDAKTRLR